MLRILALVVAGGVVFFVFNKDRIQEYKRNAIETINPAVKEKRLIGEIQDNFNRLDSLLSDKNLKLENWGQVATIVNSTQKTLDELKETNAKTDLGANLSNLIQKIVPLQEKPSPTWVPPPKECSTI
jgi:hypothetical protein